MSNKKMNLSGKNKEVLDLLCDHLQCDRPMGIKIALAKGLANTNGVVNPIIDSSLPKWTVPDSIIRENDYLLFKHLIINELQTNITDLELQEQLRLYLEFGLNTIDQELAELTSLDDYRLAIFKS